MDTSTEISGVIPGVISALLGTGAFTVSKILGGRNSRVYQVVLDDGSKYVAKFYPGKEWDGRDRLETEFTSLNFVWRNGVRAVPEPIAINRDQGCALYEFIEGQRVEESEVTPYDIDQTVQFLAELKTLSLCPGSSTLPAAGDSGLSAQAVFDSIRSRLDRLMALPGGTPELVALEVFLKSECIPYLDRTVEWVETRLTALNMSLDEALRMQERTLSPSDFGYHNVLRRKDGRLVFLDFEYFGWDDPAKLVSDFLLHPANDLPDQRKRQFLEKMVEKFNQDSQLLTRIGTIYPLIGLKWTLLLLNEFVPEHLGRRRFSVETADEESFDEVKVQNRQLALAKEMLRRSSVEFEKFPYAT